eukprot:3937126-Rhodomonas_salina.6
MVKRVWHETLMSPKSERWGPKRHVPIPAKDSMSSTCSHAQHDRESASNGGRPGNVKANRQSGGGAQQACPWTGPNGGRAQACISSCCIQSYGGGAGKERDGKGGVRR